MKPPYYAVIFTSELSDDPSGYAEAAVLMEELAAQFPGYLGFESARSELGISVSYWKDEPSILAWKSNLEHLEAQRRGMSQWYKSYRVRVCRVEREY